MTIRLAREVGLDIIANYAEKFGVYDDMQEFLANSLGSEETTLYRMVAAYAMFANGGSKNLKGARQREQKGKSADPTRERPSYVCKTTRENPNDPSQQ